MNNRSRVAGVSRGLRIVPIALVLWLGALVVPVTAGEPLFEKDVLPLLKRQCLGCHGGLRQKGGLDMRTISGMLKGGDSGAAIAAGDPKKSHIWQRVAADEMPEGNKKLSVEEKAILLAWISAGLPTVAARQTDNDPLLDAGQKHTPAQVAAAIDRHLDRTLTEAKLPIAPPSDDAEFMRRVYLDLSGRTPTAAQAAAFLDSTAANKRTMLIDELLGTPQFGEQLGRTWRDWISPPELPSDANGGKQPHEEARNLGKWLGERFNANDSWDKIVREIVTVDGEIKQKPQVIFHGLVGEGGLVSAGGSARAVGSLFMGVQLQCAECHDDPYRNWAQTQHWGMAAFFSKTNGSFSKISERLDPKQKQADRDAKAVKSASISIPKSAFLNAGKVVPAQFLASKDYRPAGDEAFRPALADWLTAKDNPYFAPAFANRMWFYLFARGIVNPVDDLRELNPPSHPGLMRLLANEFTASGYDIKHLIRSICNSRAYQRASRFDAKLPPASAVLQLELFGRMPLRVMSADVLYDSLRLAYGDPKLDLRGFDPKDGNSNGESAPVGDPYLEFARRFCTNEEDPTDYTHGIPQSLTMLNHRRLIMGSKTLDDFQKTKPTADRTIEWLYLTTLSRRPTREESSEAIEYLQKQSSDPARALPGVLWMLINRSEYQLIR